MIYAIINRDYREGMFNVVRSLRKAVSVSPGSSGVDDARHLPRAVPSSLGKPAAPAALYSVPAMMVTISI